MGAPRQEEQGLLHEPAGPLQRQQHGIRRDAKLDQDEWVIVEDDDNDSSCSLGNSTNTNGSTSSSSDMVDDASSPTSTCSSSNSNGPLNELSDLMAVLPIKRGLSKFYQGKSQSFTSLSKVTCIEDLAKKETPYTRKIKSSKSYANGLDAHKHYPLPRATISKKVSRSGHDVSALSFSGRKISFLGSANRLPPIPVQKKLFQV